MSKNNETINRELYDLLDTRGYNPLPRDSDVNNAGKTVPPEEADVMKFTFKQGNEEIDDVWVSIDGARKFRVYYDKDIVDKAGDKSPDAAYDDSWFGLIKFFKEWAHSRQLKFDLVPKEKLDSDMAQRTYMKKKEKIAEGYYPMGKSASYNDNIPTVKIILQHNRQIQEGEQRYRNIAKIFLENTQGERFLAPTVKPGLAQIYARHLAEGGVPNDERWNHIKSLCEEYSKMAGFVRAVRGNQFNESAQRLVEAGLNHYQSLRESLSKMRGHRGYNTYFESWTPTLMETEGDEPNLNELFVEETLDPRIESVMPILSKLSKNLSEVKEVKELEEWADSLLESPGAETLAHNQSTEQSRLKALDLDEDEIDDAEAAKKKMNIPAYQRKAQGGDWKVTQKDLDKIPASTRTTSQGLAAHAKRVGLGGEEGVAEGSDVEYIVVIRDEQGKRSIRVSALTPTDAKEKAEAQGYKVLKVKDPNEKHYFREQGVAEAEKNPHTSALGKALYRDLSKEKKASPQQVQRNKERWAQRQADKEQGVAEGNNSSPYDQMADLKSKSNSELDKLVRFWEQALEKNPNHKVANDQLHIIKMIRAERIGKKNVAENLGPEQKRVGQLGPTERVKKNSGARGKLVGANESVEQGVAEGDVVQFPKKHPYELLSNCPKCGGPLQSGKDEKGRLKLCIPCMKIFRAPNQQGVAEGSKVKTAKGYGDIVQGTNVKTVAKADLGKNSLNLPKGYGDVVQPQKLKTIAKAKDVAEGLSDIVKGVKRKIRGKEDPKEVGHTYARIARRDIEDANKLNNQAAYDARDKSVKRWEKVNKVVNKEGVAEGSESKISKCASLAAKYFNSEGLQKQYDIDEYIKNNAGNDPVVNKCASLAAKYFNSAGLQKQYDIDEYIKANAKQGVSEGSTNKTLFVIYYKTGKGFDAGTGDVGILASNEQKAKEKFAKKYPHFIVTKIVEGMKYVLVDYRGNYYKGMDKFGRNLSTRNPEEAEIFNTERDAKDIALWTRNRFKAIPWSDQQGVAEGSLKEDEYDKYETGKMGQEEAVTAMFTRLARQGIDPIDMIANRFGWSTYELDDLAQQQGFENTAEWLNSFEQGVVEAEKNPHTSALGKALYRDLSKEKKASPQQVQRNKERWAQRQADKEQGVAEGTPTSLMRQYRSNENNNNHSENIVLLAKHFGTPGELSVARRALKYRDEKGGFDYSDPKAKKYTDFQLMIHEKYFPLLRLKQGVAEGSLNEISQDTAMSYISKRKNTDVSGKTPQQIGKMIKGLKGAVARAYGEKPTSPAKNKEQGVAEGYHNNIMHAWNSGMSDDELVRKFGQGAFNQLKRKYGAGAIPVPDLVGYKPKEPEDKKVRLHRGLEGPGKVLKSIIKQQDVKEGQEDLDAIKKLMGK